MDFPAHPFWDFALDVYRRPGVSDACLALQERDVPVHAAGGVGHARSVRPRGLGFGKRKVMWPICTTRLPNQPVPNTRA